MSTEKLKEKLAEYELKKEELGNNDFTSEIEQELAEYKQVLEKKIRRQKGGRKREAFLCYKKGCCRKQT